ncbi:hypothetical protein [Hydrogenophaga sp. 2FB]|uniref:hypothetical protein n=1 Tax=Hydrogenophaga sp. 2FB TaxID=2502187 RepID=UPI0010F8E85B|nr:hypothetical protein [Hydrogenophaga sp. 2FB]
MTQATPITENTIHVTGPFVAKDRRGVVWGVHGATIPGEGFIPDLSIHLDRSGAFEAELCEDKVFLGNVFEELRKAGYIGSTFTRAEMGMQQDDVVVLEPSGEFNLYAIIRHGFVLLD